VSTRLNMSMARSMIPVPRSTLYRSEPCSRAASIPFQHIFYAGRIADLTISADANFKHERFSIIGEA
jgi:hypothetical protein